MQQVQLRGVHSFGVLGDKWNVFCRLITLSRFKWIKAVVLFIGLSVTNRICL